jgi:hypothetical protein
MSWANSVLPVFMAASGQMLGRLPESAIVVQIDTTLRRPEIRVSQGFQRFTHSFNRTAVNSDEYSNILVRSLLLEYGGLPNGLGP